MISTNCMNISSWLLFMNYFACDQCMNKGGGLMRHWLVIFRVPSNVQHLLQTLLGHDGKNDMRHYQPWIRYGNLASKQC